MARDNQAIQDDIAYMRALAHEGRHAPLLAGPILVTAAIVFGAATLLQWLLQVETLKLSPWAPLWLWIGAGVIFGGILSVLLARMKGRPGYNATGNRAVGAAWSGVGYGIFVTWLGLAALSMKTGNWSWMAVMPTVVLVAYGSAWIIGAAMTGVRWMGVVAMVSYVGAVAVAWFIDGPILYLLFTALLVAVALIPGLILMRQEPAEVI